MKVFMLFIAVIFTVTQVKTDHAEEMHKLDMECRKESQVSEDEINGFMQGKLKGDPKEALKCHMKCLMDKQGYWKNGGFDAAAVATNLKDVPELKTHQNEISKMIQDCKDKKGANECDTAYLITKCATEHFPEAI